MTFAARLDEVDQQIALIGEEGEQLSYADLARRADAFAAEHFGGSSAGKRIVLLQIRNDIESGVRYLGALRAGHAVILAGDRKRVVEGKSVSVRVDIGGRRILKKKKETESYTYTKRVIYT